MLTNARLDGRHDKDLSVRVARTFFSTASSSPLICFAPSFSIELIPPAVAKAILSCELLLTSSRCSYVRDGQLRWCAGRGLGLGDALPRVSPPLCGLGLCTRAVFVTGTRCYRAAAAAMEELSAGG